MEQKTLTRRDIDVNKIVLPEHDCSESSFGMYKVWQPNQEAFFRAFTEKMRAPKGLRCITHHLRFAEDFNLAAFVVAKDMDDVFGCLNVNEDSDERAKRVIWLRPDASPGSTGDVFVSPEGDAQFVTVVGFRPVEDDLFSDEHFTDALIS
ncbi:hypothetical protein [Bythopirellula goksoeyrii]|uniref:Uncharacterized protein n=1 Tax=Bythopirellula goksoeyrii TaxID=1400387 RepID=A0A5B9QJ30_9BACT|nr:hypothetical protein [Bythopirellula goksoeyrii]QEG37722.1 hypothetical protein Pr1d_50680 [Bythopirellula goksoeyrii]